MFTFDFQKKFLLKYTFVYFYCTSQIKNNYYLYKHAFVTSTCITIDACCLNKNLSKSYFWIICTFSDHFVKSTTTFFMHSWHKVFHVYLKKCNRVLWLCNYVDYLLQGRHLTCRGPSFQNIHREILPVYTAQFRGNL